MSEWFQAKVKFAKQLDNGLIKQSTELYLIDAVSFTDAETRAFKEAGDNRDVQAVSIARSPIKEVVFYGDTDLWHKVKVCYSLMDEATEKEKKVTTYFLVNSKDVKQAYERTEEHLKTMLVPFRIPKVEESPICDVFQYEKQAPKGTVKADNNGVGSESPFVKQHGWGASPEDEHEEECAMESDSIEAIDPTDGQSIGFEMDLRAYLMQIRPHDWVKLTTEIEKVWEDNPKALQFCLAMNGLSHDEQDHVADILSNEAAFDQDEEANETDLEGRFGLAMKGGVRITDPLWTLLHDNGILCLDQDLHEIRSWKDSPFRDFHECMDAQFDATETVSKIIWEYLKTENEAMKGGGDD